MIWELDIENAAGIHPVVATIEPGPNVVHAENWQGKSLFLKFIRTMSGTISSVTKIATGSTEDAHEIDPADWEVVSGGMRPESTEEYLQLQQSPQ